MKKTPFLIFMCAVFAIYTSAYMLFLSPARLSLAAEIFIPQLDDRIVERPLGRAIFDPVYRYQELLSPVDAGYAQNKAGAVILPPAHDRILDTVLTDYAEYIRETRMGMILGSLLLIIGSYGTRRMIKK